MGNIIDDLWHENLIPPSEEIYKSPELKQLISDLEQQQSELMKTMTDEQKLLFEKYKDFHISYTSLCESAVFEYGFKLSVKLILAALTD